MKTKHPDACSLLLVNKKHEVLLQLRDNIPWIWHPNMLGTFGGAIEPGETPDEAMVRETAEELGGYKLTNFRRFHVADYEDHKIFVFLKYDPDLKADDYKVTEGQKAIFIGESDLGNPKIVPIMKEILIEFFHRLKYEPGILR